MEGNDVAILRDLIEGNPYSFGRVIEEYFQSATLCHLSH